MTINNLSGNGFWDSVLIFCAEYVIFAVALVFAVLLALAARRRGAAPVVGSLVTLAVTFALGLLAAAVHSEQRPFQSHPVHLLIAHAPGQSFPSDHASASFAIALATLAFLSRPWGAALLAAATLIGFARVYAGIHYPVDIAGSLLVAVLGLVAGVLAARLVRDRRRTAARTRPATG